MRGEVRHLHGRKGRAGPAFEIFPEISKASFLPHFLKCGSFHSSDNNKFECVALIPVDRS
jgi:hypothetical protein